MIEITRSETNTIAGKKSKMKQTKLKILLLTVFMFFLSILSFTENRVLIVGIADYPGSINDIDGPERDTELMQEIAKKIGFKDNQIKVLLNSNATRDNILGQFRHWLIEGVGKNDKVLFYFSGHGYQVADKNGDESDACDESLVPYESKLEYMIIDDKINELISDVPSKQMMIIIDSCFSGTATKLIDITNNGKMLKSNAGCNDPENLKSISVVDDKETDETDRKYIAMSAAAQNEVARGAFQKGEGSLFTQGMYNIIKRSRNPLSFKELRNKLAEHIKGVCAVSNWSTHTPQIEGNETYFSKDIFSFVTHDYSFATDIEDKEMTKTNFDFLERIVMSRQFLVLMKSKSKNYKIGDELAFEVTPSKGGYLNILEIDPKRSINVIFPNKFNSNNEVTAGEKIEIPGPKIGQFKFVAKEPYGESHVIAIVTKRPLNLYKAGIGEITGHFKSIRDDDAINMRDIFSKSISVEPDGEMEFGAGEVKVKIEAKK